MAKHTKRPTVAEIKTTAVKELMERLPMLSRVHKAVVTKYLDELKKK